MLGTGQGERELTLDSWRFFFVGGGVAEGRVERESYITQAGLKLAM